MKKLEPYQKKALLQLLKALLCLALVIVCETQNFETWGMPTSLPIAFCFGMYLNEMRNVMSEEETRIMSELAEGWKERALTAEKKIEG